MKSTLDALTRAAARERPAHAALIAGDRALTWAELDREVDRVAAWLQGVGVARGDRVGIHLPKCIEEVAATLAVGRLGAVWVNINDRWTLDQLDFVRGDCDIEVLITDFRRAKKLPDDYRAVLVRGKRAPDNAVPWAALEASGPIPCPAIGADLATLLYTSGSTGMPKGVMLTQRHLVDGARIVTTYLENTEDDRLLSLLPLSFDYGLNQLTSVLWLGATLVLLPVMMPAEVVATCAEHGVTGLAAVPPAWIQIVRYLQSEQASLPGLRYVTNSGGKIPPAVLDGMPEVFPNTRIFLMYGLTEAFRSTYLPPHLYAAKKGSIGCAIPDNEVFVVDGDRLCEVDEVGELVHRGSTVSAGYWRRPEQTAARIRVCPALPWLGEERVVYSGDLVRRDADGILWFVSRADSMLKVSGFRLSPTEVEDAVFGSGLVGDVVAWGVEDEELGQVVHIAVTGHDGPLDVAALGAWCTRNLAPYMIPREIVAWDGPMPRTGSGKLDRPRIIPSET